MAEFLTVRTALELEVFTRTTVRVYAGERNLDRPVRWVHTGEIPDIHRFLTGQEMLLTAGLGMGATELEQRAFIRRLADAHAAVLVIELAGRMFATMPEAVVEEAEAVGLPLVGLTDEIPFVETSAQVHEVLVGTRVKQLIAEEATSQAFMDLLLADEDYVGVVRELARRTGYPVVLEDVAHQMLAYGGASPEGDRVVDEWSAHSRAIHERHPSLLAQGPGVPTASAASFREVAPCARQPVVLRGESWGWLHLLHGRRQPSPPELRTLERAAAAVAISLLSEREGGARASQRQTALLNRLLLGDITGERFVTLGLALGQDLRGRDLIVVTAWAGDEEHTKDHLLARLLREAGWPAVVGDTGDFDMAVVGLPAPADAGHVRTLLADHGVRGGLSRIVEPAALPLALRQSRSAASVAAAASTGEVRHFDDLGALRLLVALSEGPELRRYVEDELGPLLEHDALVKNPLLPTLRTFLDSGGNKARAAEELFIQRRTLYHRLDKLSEILGLDLTQVSNQQRLQLAVRGQDLLRKPTLRRT
ncbi:PucR family transcriptional regulator [Streptomyces antimycoticus]|uniref:CdaR family transcriptional regulator n=1 Tax=Streptomyces antimycoticus TaxID=68175 RepID=A0A4D4KAK4_9ACTN|nr:PucR family transcriptional regulator [Streptomyces antimycoticus]GDY45184.1 CdaR family transcriptional regulator [Streptomyces antimycoticus]